MNVALFWKRLLSILIVLVVCAPQSAWAVVHVVTTTPGYADIVKNVGGSLVSVEAVMRGPENPHNVRPRPSQMMKLKRAELFVHSGLDGEAWAPLLVKGARNPKLLPGQVGYVDVSRGITLMEVPKAGQLSRALGDIHVFGNTHYALDPRNGIIIARTIASALKRVDSGHADQYEKNYQAYADRLRKLDQRLEAAMKPYAGTRVVTYHRTWSYFLNRYGLVSIGEVEPKPGITPGPRHLAECVEKMKAEGARIVIVGTFNSRDNAQNVAKRVGGRAVVLAQEVRALPGVDTYEKMFEYDVKTLIDAFDRVGIQPAGKGPAAKDGASADSANDTP